MQLGHAVGLRPRETDNGDEVAVKLASGEGPGQVFPVVEDDRRPVDPAVLGLTAAAEAVGYDVTMNISITLPDDVAEQMQAHGCNLPRRALEVLVADGYRAGILTGAQVQRILGLGSRWEVEELLYQAGADLGYGAKELREDLEALRELPNP